jgi:hypothetical protein
VKSEPAPEPAEESISTKLAEEDENEENEQPTPEDQPASNVMMVDDENPF